VPKDEGDRLLEFREADSSAWFPNGAVIVNGRYWGAWTREAREYHALLHDLAIRPTAYLYHSYREMFVSQVDLETKTVTLGIRRSPSARVRPERKEKADAKQT
jgi:hypothetical protein